MGEVCSTHCEMRNAYKILVGRPKENRKRERFKCRMEDNIRNDFKGVGLEDVEWIQL
jgi:K+-sensing histidine kinase KdpD